MKKEEIAVKLTTNNLQKVLKILNEYNQEYCTYYTTYSLQYIVSDFEKTYIFYSADSKVWHVSAAKPQGRTLIKPKQLKELLENKPSYNFKYWANQLWEVTKVGIGDKGIEYKPTYLEVGKWYKHPNFSDGRFLFMFMGEFGYAKAIGFDASGRYCNDLSIHEEQTPEYTEANPEEVIEAFIYYMENFTDKRKNITTAELRDILNQFYREEISLNKVVELVNEGGK